jgi:tetrahydromethanopterin S-methyltransferase subunit D
METENITLAEVENKAISFYDVLFYLLITLIIVGWLLYIYGKSNVYVSDKVKEGVSWVEEKTQDLYYSILFNNKVQGNTIKVSL